MPEFRTIEIDFDVYKLIEAERRSFDEPRIAALRRLLKLPAKANAEPAVIGKSAERAWSGEGVILAHGTRVRMSYNGRQYDGEIVDGNWVIEGKAFGSPSGAASGSAITKNGKTTRLDGWIYWEVQAPGDAGWTPIKALRPKRIAPRNQIAREGATVKDLDL